jgi:hypothetical protein
MQTGIVTATHPMQRLQIELVGGLGRDELHRRTKSG